VQDPGKIAKKEKILWELLHPKLRNNSLPRARQFSGSID